MRLNRFLAAAGLGSRRNCEELILAGQITINGVMCTTLATQVEPTDVVKAGNRVLHTAASMTVLLHKPVGFLCTASDEENRRTVFDLLPANFPRLFHVGRLDMESEGLLILTNDGDLALKLTHPRYKAEKEYEVTLETPFDFAQAEKLLHGMRLAEGWAVAEAVHRLGANKVKVILRQGMKRQIRLMFYELGYEVKRLVRTRIGPIRIEGLPLAHWRVLTQREVESLTAGGLAPKKGVAGESPRHPAHAEAKEGNRTARPTRPAHAPGARRFPGSDRPKSPRKAGGKPEEIPFTPRSRSVRRAEATGGEFRGKHTAGSFKSQDEEMPRPGTPERSPGKPSKEFIAKFFASKIAKQGGKAAGKAFAGKQSAGKLAKGRAGHAPSAQRGRSGPGRSSRPSR